MNLRMGLFSCLQRHPRREDIYDGVALERMSAQMILPVILWWQFWRSGCDVENFVERHFQQHLRTRLM
jgi:hypothetical protein